MEGSLAIVRRAAIGAGIFAALQAVGLVTVTVATPNTVAIGEGTLGGVLRARLRGFV